MPTNEPKVLIPPWLLTSAALLCWGLSSGNLLIALVLAVILDGRRWMPMSWKFEEPEQVRAFQLCVILAGASLLLSWLDDQGRDSALVALRWAPVLAFPLEFVQRYGHLKTMSLNSFFYFSRRQMLLDQQEGRELRTIDINTGYLYVLGTLMASCTEENGAWYYGTVACVVLFWMFFAVARQRRIKVRGMLLVLPVVVALGWGIQSAVSVTYRWIKGQIEGAYQYPGNDTMLTDMASFLSELGSVDLNPRIEWRVWSDTNPEYLRLASHNNYNHGRWTYDYPHEGYERLNDSYTEHFRATVMSSEGMVTYFAPEDKAEAQRAADIDAMRVRGTVSGMQPTTVVPAPLGFYAVRDILGDSAYVEVSSMGALRVSDREAVVSYTLFDNPYRKSLDREPMAGVDLRIPKNEQEVVRQLADELGLRKLKGDPQAVIEKIRAHFTVKFTYSTHFDAGERPDDRSQLDWFLNEVKCGHCEYYATAGALLLREVGIPARYATGYSVTERGSGCWNVRGTNAHAWTLAYLNGRWTNVDFTPADRRGVVDQGGLNAAEWLRERVSLWREDFYIWRQDGANRAGLIRVGGSLSAVIALWILFRLWRSRTKPSLVQRRYVRWDGGAVQTPLHALEKRAVKLIGPRTDGETYARWFAKLEAQSTVEASLLNQAIELHQQMRFADSECVRAELAALAKQLKKQMRKA